MDKTRKNKDILQKLQEKPTKIPKKQESSHAKSIVLTEKTESPEGKIPDPQKLKQNLREMQAKNVALNTSLAESQVSVSNLQVEVARLEKKLQELMKERGKFEESQYLSNKVSNELMKEKQRNNDLTEKLEEMHHKSEKMIEERDLKLRKILHFIQKAKEMSTIVGGLKGRFFEKVDLVGSWKETFRKIEDLIKKDLFLDENETDSAGVEEMRADFLKYFKDYEEENSFLRGKLEEMGERMKESKETLEKYQLNFERVREKLDELKEINSDVLEENEALKRQIDAVERKSENQAEIIEILKMRIKAFEEEIEIEEEPEEMEEPDEPNNRKISLESENNDGLEKEIQDLDHEIRYIQGILNNKM